MLRWWMRRGWGWMLGGRHEKERKTVRFCDGPPKCSFSGQRNQLKKWWWVTKCKKKELKTEFWLF
jgi:hypothetical protein